MESAAAAPGGDAYTETFQFSSAHKAKAVAIAMRGPRASGYFGISQVVMESAAAAPTMLVAGVTAAEELCVAVENGSVGQRGALVTAEPCAEAIAAGDGREVFVMTEAGQLAVGGAGSGLCAILAGNSASGGGEIELDDCEAAAETGDGRSFWALAPSGQLTMGGGSHCMVLAGGSCGNGADVAPTATVSATATADSAHGAEKLTDGDATSYWQSPPAETLAGGALSLGFELAATARVSSVVIDWQEPALDFTVQTAEEGGQWSTFAEVQGNTLGQTVVRGSSVVAKKVRVLLTAPVGGAYAAKAVRILSAPLQMAVQDCAEASTHGDARDLFFPEPAPEFDPRATAPLLAGAVRQLGQYTAELSALKPKIEACKAASFLGEGASFLALGAKVGEAPRYQQQHRKTTDGRLCAPASAQDEQTFAGCSSMASADGSVGRPWCYLAPQLVDASGDAQNWQYCAGVIDYDAVRAAALPEFAAAIADIHAGKARASLAERAVEKTLAVVSKVCG